VVLCQFAGARLVSCIWVSSGSSGSSGIELRCLRHPVIHLTSSCCNPLHPQHPQSCQPAGGICWGYWELIGIVAGARLLVEIAVAHIARIHRLRGRALQPVAPARKRR
jgi:hypothetical protein